MADNTHTVPERLVSLKTIKAQLNHRYDQQTQREIFTLGLTKYKIGYMAKYDHDQFKKNLNNSQNIQIPMGITYDEIRKALGSLQ